MDGGGAEPAITLTADLVARAVIAAALAYGDDPVVSMTSANRTKRRALSAAVSGLNLALDVPVKRLAPILGLNKTTIFVTRTPSQRTPAFTAAERAAMRAAEFAAWRPEAAESAIGDADDDEISGAAAGDELPSDADREVAAPDAPPMGAPGGRLSSWTQSPNFQAAGVPKADVPVADLVLAALADGPLNTMSLAALVDHKEMSVCSALSNLEHLGRVVSTPAESGPRKFVWSLAEPSSAAA